MDARAEERAPGPTRQTGLPSGRLHAGRGGLLRSLPSLSIFNYPTLPQGEHAGGERAEGLRPLVRPLEFQGP